MTDNCGNCRFLRKPPLLTKHEGQCRRNPPIAQMIPAGGGQAQIMTFHPVVKFTDWCGCHEPVETVSRARYLGGKLGSVDGDVINHGDGTITFKPDEIE